MAAGVNLFLYRPHALDADGAIVTPDILLERVRYGDAVLGVERLTSLAGPFTADEARAALVHVAFADGSVVAPAIVLAERGAVATIVLARQAWHVRDLLIAPGEAVVTPHGAPLPARGMLVVRLTVPPDTARELTVTLATPGAPATIDVPLPSRASSAR